MQRRFDKYRADTCKCQSNERCSYSSISVESGGIKAIAWKLQYENTTKEDIIKDEKNNSIFNYFNIMPIL